MAKLPQELSWTDADNKWAAILNPVINQPLISGRLVTNVSLSIGMNQVNHGLGRKLQGWIVVGLNAPAQIYDAQAQNQMPQLTLTLISDANCIASLWVF